ncbi:B12-binding domain-containing radical SAM protein [Marinobacterium mangrovicola]|uniref:Radical SAM superfamily enzyme YgiQ (UPF0313 family) n=1 Tax=Marinobacterium mangrovicola TaxID=1476959 RepID=A0A4V2PE01_9GAMM|nr:radical SAM protein [Marinobacterium mangrovicola]TCK07176.1 radical SAM superfamily enzyme YgiQ (UPF0313 family) [Marinobacterium mangrovicola]
MDRIFCISAGQLIVKKSDTVINRQNRYLNYGLLSLATELRKSGWNALQIQGLFESPIETVKKCIDFGFCNLSTLPFLISVPSFYAISWVNEFISLIKEINSSVKIIIGGRWVIADRSDLMQSLVPDADIVVPGLADRNITRIVESCLSFEFEKLKIPVSTLKNSLDYNLLYERELYQPSLEVSRGCGMGCSFCQEKNEPLQRLKSSSIIIDEAKSILIDDNLNKMNIYFESSMFIPTRSWVESLKEKREHELLFFDWRSESRVDTINLKLVKHLAEAGLKVLDLGLESASKSQLIRMGKTRNAALYLDRASRLLKECHVNGIFVKINILLFAGETSETISETIEWLMLHRQYIKGVSVGPLIVFGWECNTEDYIKELQSYGASRSHMPTEGVQHINLSDEIDHGKAIDISKEISEEFMTKEDYFYLKSFSYFSRDYRFEDFKNDLTR